MRNFLNFLLLIFSISSITTVKRTKFAPYIRFTSSKCWTSSKSVDSFKCFVKAYSHTNASLNVYVNLSRPLYDLNARYDLAFKYLTNSPRSVINTTIEVCKFLNGTGTNPVFKWIIGFMENFGHLLHPCPYKGNVIFKELSVNMGKFVSAFPNGIYVSFIKFYDSFDDNVLTLKYTQEIVSKDKEEF